MFSLDVAPSAKGQQNNIFFSFFSSGEDSTQEMLERLNAKPETISEAQCNVWELQVSAVLAAVFFCNRETGEGGAKGGAKGGSGGSKAMDVDTTSSGVASMDIADAKESSTTTTSATGAKPGAKAAAKTTQYF